MKKDNHKVPLKLRIRIAKDKKFLRFIDNIISLIKPPRPYNGLPGKILVLRNDRIGDAMVTLPVLRDIKLNYPEIKIHVLASLRNRFVFEGKEYIDDVFVLEPSIWKKENAVFNIPLIGRLLETIFLFVLPYRFDPEFRAEIDRFREENYDAAMDLSGARLNLKLARKISSYTVGSMLFGRFWLYSFYINTNWVSQYDRDFMTRKIEKCFMAAFGFRFDKRDETPVLKLATPPEKDFDIMFHLGTTELRKLNFEREKELVERFSGLRLLVTDAGPTDRFRHYSESCKDRPNIEFKLYRHLSDAAKDAARCKILVCYDGGQALYLSQFVTTLVIFGPGSVHLWKPYEFRDYIDMKNWKNGVKAIQSTGKYNHTAIYYPVWCSPCYDIGCQTRPCMEKISTAQIDEVIEELIK